MNYNNIFQGVITASTTPFYDNQIDMISLKKMIEYQIQNGIKAIVIAGSTGEGYSLTEDEYMFLLFNALDIAQDRIMIIANICAISTDLACKIAIKAQSIGAQAIQCAIPPYIKPTQDGIYQHFKQIHDDITIPIILYSIPGRTGIDFTDDTILELSILPRILAIKDASKDVSRVLRLVPQLKHNLQFLAGDDELCVAYNIVGSIGCVSVISNILPELCIKIQSDWNNGNIDSVIQSQTKMSEICRAMFVEQNPIGIKYAMYVLGLSTQELRKPLTIANAITQNRINTVIHKYCKNRSIM